MLSPRELCALVCFAAGLALLVVAFARRRSTGRWFPLLVAALLVSGCCSAEKPARMARPATTADWGACYRCGRTWEHATPHETRYAPDRSLFPLCDECWPALTPRERLPYYGDLVATWPSADDSTRSAVRNAVMRGD